MRTYFYRNTRKRQAPNITAYIAWLAFFMGIGSMVLHWEVAKFAKQSVQLEQKGLQILTPIINDYYKAPETQPEPEIQKTVITGKASYYTASDEGCLGCREDRRMANGQVFDENAMTLATPIIGWTDEGYGIPQIPLNTKVKVTNTTNGKTAIARVTDTGGFNKPEYGNRVADLSAGLAKAIELKTDQIIKLEVLE